MTSTMGSVVLGVVLLTFGPVLVQPHVVDRLDGATATLAQSTTEDAFLQIAPPAVTASPGPADLGTPVKVIPGKVGVVLGTLAFREGERIRATIANGLQQTIYTDDAKTDCSIVFLERRVENDWQSLQACPLGRAPRVVAMGPGRGRAVTIDPFSVYLRLGAPPDGARPALRAGRYRIKFTYRLSPTPEAEEPFVVFSPTFPIRP